VFVEESGDEGAKETKETRETRSKATVGEEKRRSTSKKEVSSRNHDLYVFVSAFVRCDIDFDTAYICNSVVGSDYAATQ